MADAGKQGTYYCWENKLPAVEFVPLRELIDKHVSKYGVPLTPAPLHHMSTDSNSTAGKATPNYYYYYYP